MFDTLGWNQRDPGGAGPPRLWLMASDSHAAREGQGDSLGVLCSGVWLCGGRCVRCTVCRCVGVRCVVYNVWMCRCLGVRWGVCSVQCVVCGFSGVWCEVCGVWCAVCRCMVCSVWVCRCVGWGVGVQCEPDSASSWSCFLGKVTSSCWHSPHLKARCHPSELS